MTSQCTAQLLADLGVTRSLSRPQVSDDNPFSEAQFKTLKYHPSFPGRFGDQGQAKTFCRSFFRWYNAEHRHGGISMLTPEQVHFGNADQAIAGRKSVLREAWAAHPERFVRGVPKPNAPGGRLHQSSHPFPHHTGHCSLINPVECPIVVDRFRWINGTSRPTAGGFLPFAAAVRKPRGFFANPCERRLSSAIRSLRALRSRMSRLCLDFFGAQVAGGKSAALCDPRPQVGQRVLHAIPTDSNERRATSSVTSYLQKPDCHVDELGGLLRIEQPIVYRGCSIECSFVLRRGSAWKVQGRVGVP